MNEPFLDSRFRSGEESPANEVSDDSLHKLIGRPAPPPLRIHHILIVTAVAAVLLWVIQQIRQNDFIGLNRAFSSSWGATYTIATAISVTLVMLGFSWRRGGYAFFDLPGHWLLLTHALGIGLFLAVAIALAMRAIGDDSYNMLPMYVYFGGVQLTLLVMNAYASWKIADSIAWRIYFLLQACQLVLMFGVGLFVARYGHIAMLALSYGPFVLLIVAAIGDLMARRVRDWPHWVGVALPCAAQIAYGCQLLFS